MSSSRWLPLKTKVLQKQSSLLNTCSKTKICIKMSRLKFPKNHIWLMRFWLKAPSLWSTQIMTPRQSLKTLRTRSKQSSLFFPTFETINSRWTRLRWTRKWPLLSFRKGLQSTISWITETSRIYSPLCSLWECLSTSSKELLTSLSSQQTGFIKENTELMTCFRAWETFWEFWKTKGGEQEKLFEMDSRSLAFNLN